MMIQRKWFLMVVMLLGLTVQAQEQKTYDQFFLEAMIQREKGNNDAAFDLLRHCQELNPDAPEVYFFLGQYYSLLKNTENGADLYPPAGLCQCDSCGRRHLRP